MLIITEGNSKMIEYGTNENWAYHSNIECVVFTVSDDGKKITCKVSMEAITDHFGNCDEQGVLDKAKEHFDEITDQIGDKIGKKRFEDDGSILLRSGDW